jgi:sigma-E factor negative regulatory protein RseC
MITTTARVIETQDGIATVESSAKSSCGSCHSRGQCGIAGLGKYFSGSPRVISIRCESKVRAGDELQVSMSEADFLKAGLLAYLLPSLCTISGAGLADTLHYGDAGAVAGALSGLALGLLLVRLIRWAPIMTVHQFNQGELP